MKDTGEAWYIQRIKGLASWTSRSCSRVSVKRASRRLPKRTTTGERLTVKSARYDALRASARCTMALHDHRHEGTFKTLASVLRRKTRVGAES
jgi:hypothetical protein